MGVLSPLQLPLQLPLLPLLLQPQLPRGPPRPRQKRVQAAEISRKVFEKKEKCHLARALFPWRPLLCIRLLCVMYTEHRGRPLFVNYYLHLKLPRKHKHYSESVQKAWRTASRQGRKNHIILNQPAFFPLVFFLLLSSVEK